MVCRVSDEPAATTEQDRSAEACAFCAIVSGQSDATRVYEDEHLLAFMDTHPVTPGHLLVVPKKHAAFLRYLPEAHGAGLFVVGQRLATALLDSGLRCEGVNFFLADGTAAGQEVYHVHLHVFPRFADDGFRLDANWSEPTRGDLEDTAKKIRAGLDPEHRAAESEPAEAD
ncbi:HIT family protein [soil metagenome]